MVKEVNYDYLNDEFKELERRILPKKNNFRKDIRDTLKNENQDYKPETKTILKRLNHIQEYANNGEFRKIPDASETFVQILYSYNHESQPGDHDKYLQSLSTRLDRASSTAIRYLKENKNKITKDEINDIKRLLEYSKDFKEKLNKKHESSGLEKAITVISLGSMVFGVAIGYPALTGNAIADVVPASFVHGAALFFVGLVGVFLANKK